MEAYLTASSADDGSTTTIKGFVGMWTRDGRDGDRWTVRVHAEGVPGDLAVAERTVKYRLHWPNGRECDEPSGYVCHQADLGIISGCGAPGACVAGTVEETPCGAMHKTRTCDRTCQWSEWSACGAWRPMAPAPASFVSRTQPTAALAGTQVVFVRSDGDAGPIRAAAYDAAADTWSALPDGPSAWLARTAVGTSAGELFIWSSGGPLVLVAGPTPGWSKLTPPAEFTPREPSNVVSAFASATGEVLFWACPWSPATDKTPDAIAWHPTRRTWRTIPSLPVARSTCGAHRVGETIAFSHGDAGRTISLYDALADAWTSTTVPFKQYILTRDALTAFSGGGVAPVQVAMLDAAALGWTALPIPSPGQLPLRGRDRAFVGAIGDRPYLWGGGTYESWAADGAVYDSAAGRWSALPAGGPTARFDPLVIAVGAESIVWGGIGDKPQPNGMRLVLE
jgi:hypothetical protein